MALGLVAATVIVVGGGCASLDMEPSLSLPEMSLKNVGDGVNKKRYRSLDGLTERPRDGSIGRTINDPETPVAASDSSARYFDDQDGITTAVPPSDPTDLDTPASPGLARAEPALQPVRSTRPDAGGIASPRETPRVSIYPNDLPAYDDPAAAVAPSDEPAADTVIAWNDAGNAFAITQVQMEYAGSNKMFVFFNARVHNDRRETMIIKGGVFRFYLGEDMVGRATSNDSYTLEPGQSRDERLQLQVFNKALFDSFRNQLAEGPTRYALRAKLYYQRRATEQSVLTYDVEAEGKLIPRKL